MIPFKLRRALTVAIPFFTALLLLGILGGIFGIEIGDSITGTGITMAFIFGILNGWMTWMVFKHRVP